MGRGRGAVRNFPILSFTFVRTVDGPVDGYYLSIITHLRLAAGSKAAEEKSEAAFAFVGGEGR